ncbi:MAG TPA: glutamyl-tRNA reductase [Myxococcota bacterium]|nr:glutamyl-tRNA reductase [Myxococcota bacterium]
MNVIVTGMNHRSAPVEVRERFAVVDPGPALAKLVASDEVEEAVLVSTCNRVEAVALVRDLDAGRLRLRSFFRRELAGEAALPPAVALEEVLYEHTGAVALQHVLRVTASLDSLVVGEPQILGQMKDAWRAALASGACGPILSRLFERAFSTAKRVRSETAIGERPVSVARVAVDLARQIFEDLADKSALLVGAGEMIELALEALRAQGLTGVRVANRTRRHAEELAARFGASAHGLDELPALLARSDVVLTCLGGDAPLLGRRLFEEALRARRGRPLFAIDIAVPRNVAPEVNQLENVYLYDLDDLVGVAEANVEQRRREQLRAEAIVVEEQQRFDAWLAVLQAVPTIRDLRARAERLRVAELERALGRLGLDPAQREGVEQLSRALVNKLLHAPVSRLREAAERDEALAHLEAARALFGLDEAPVDDEAAAPRSGGEPEDGSDS